MKPSQHSPLFVALLVGVSGLGVASRGAAQTALPKSSPFMSSAVPATASAPTETIEFAAVRTIGKQTEIDLYDTQGKKNHWIPVGGTVDGLTVVGYDAHRDQVTATIGGVNKVLKLRQSKGSTMGPTPIQPQPTAMSFATPAAAPAVAPASAAPASGTPTVEPAANPAPSANVAAASTPTPAPAQPATPLTIARQEEEARMLVSDLLEIGMAQRKAYEEKQKQAADPNAASAANATPSTAPAQPAPGGPPSGS